MFFVFLFFFNFAGFILFFQVLYKFIKLYSYSSFKFDPAKNSTQHTMQFLGAPEEQARRFALVHTNSKDSPKQEDSNHNANTKCKTHEKEKKINMFKISSMRSFYD